MDALVLCMDAVVVCFPYQQGLSGSSQVSAHGLAAVWGAGPAWKHMGCWGQLATSPMRMTARRWANVLAGTPAYLEAQGHISWGQGPPHDYGPPPIDRSIVLVGGPSFGPVLVAHAIAITIILVLLVLLLLLLLLLPLLLLYTIYNIYLYDYTTIILLLLLLATSYYYYYYYYHCYYYDYYLLLLY